MGRDRYPKQSLGSLYRQIKDSRVLMVGAGGIGCELLKNLVLTGFGEIHIVDLDTIDLSNLNRQFLFRHEHIKKSKALVAKESAGRFNPNVKIEAHHANIKDPQFNVDYFKSFAVVFNALDNLEARRHVNKMCLAANVALVESGTTGFNGQVSVIKKGKTECYDCTHKETPKSFPVCTIRSTPSQPIHCIVWGKSYLLTEIFGTSEDDSPELDHSEDSENLKELEKLRQESQALKVIRGSMGSEDFPRLVFNKVFKEDIERLRSMEEMWKTRKAPQALDYDKLSQEALGSGTAIAQQDQVTWTLAENFSVFVDSIRRLSSRLEDLRASSVTGNAPPILSFDKDDVDTLDFVAATANLRSYIFGIEMKSKFDIKQMAGNIIPAIATTNAMTAGLAVLQGFKIMRDELDKAKTVFLNPGKGLTERATLPEPPRPPKPDCPVCSVAQTRLIVDTSRATLNDLVEDFLKLELGYGDEFSVNSEAGTLYDPELDDNLSKKFPELGVNGDSFLTIIDEEDENPRVNLVLAISELPLPKDSKPIHLPEKLSIARKPKQTPAPSETNVNGAVTNGAVKRKRDADEAELEDELIRKRGKVAEESSKAIQNGDAIVLDDSADGAIVIDDD
ncbi:putative ubiquitin-like activating enzyme [Mytilinidion resinicola]|uniref:Ubiquitin-activating enzyme E1-like n=1 Tax=Mytilinidion resinicola TaxID=574789 RepID=A0A6A6Y837_9PEZI|nr:putative ubiquitin-like activating enzyme [Mytilinidion resinicola]KAF2804850.1 putative ubiquitin-like activating enzyme [Mytilinidion resinicola]